MFIQYLNIYKVIGVYGLALCASMFKKKIDYTDKGSLILRDFNRPRPEETIDNGRDGDGKDTFHVFTIKT